MRDTRFDIYRAGDAWLIKSGQAQCGPHSSVDEAIEAIAASTKERPGPIPVAIYLWDRSFPELVTLQAR